MWDPVWGMKLIQVSVTQLGTCGVPCRSSRQPDPQAIFSPAPHGTAIPPHGDHSRKRLGARGSCPPPEGDMALHSDS